MREPAADGLRSREGRFELVVNGELVEVKSLRDAPLMMVLLNGPKYGCGLGQCGACTVMVDGVAARSCVIPVGGVEGRQITTLEGLADAGQLHAVQEAFIEAQAAQCGYCLNGMIMTSVALLNRNADPSDDDIRQELSANFCRCGTHVEIMHAVKLAAQNLRSRATEPAT
jgi:nicotinate dehydrogenase subunit A